MKKVKKEINEAPTTSNSNMDSATCMASLKRRPSFVVDNNSLIPLLNLQLAHCDLASFKVYESVYVFSNEYRKLYQVLFDKIVHYDFEAIFEVIFTFWNQVKSLPHYGFVLHNEEIKAQVIAYDERVLHILQNYFLANPLQLEESHFQSFLGLVSFHLPFSAKRAMQPLLPGDLYDAKSKLFDHFADALQCNPSSRVHTSSASTSPSDLQNHPQQQMLIGGAMIGGHHEMHMDHY